ncbi:MAG TPA: LolA-related protein [Usitatibacter sp.]|jgi:outer membrane lipoprotein-sorting protein|nr:LolA-related protein [Usitatibacter sp.]
MRRRLAAAAAAFAFACGPVAAAAAFDVAALMTLLHASHPARATFRETKYLRVLDQPVETTGELRFTPPDHLEKRSVGLNGETLVADKDMVTIERGGRTQALSLAQYPDIAVFVDSIRGTLAGDRALLEKAYRLSLKGTQARWTLTLVPRDEKLTRIVKRIVITGSQAEVRRVEIDQADGDHSVMAITPAAP